MRELSDRRSQTACRGCGKFAMRNSQCANIVADFSVGLQAFALKNPEQNNIKI